MEDKFAQVVSVICKKNITYNLIVSGIMAVGKTSRFKKLVEILKMYKCVQVYPEFFEYDKLCAPLLKEKLSGNVSPFTFQNFVYDVYAKMYKNKPLLSLNIFERLISEPSRVFTEGLSREECAYLRKRERSISRAHNIPTLDSKLHYTELCTKVYENDDFAKNIEYNLKELYNIMLHDVNTCIENSTFNRFVYMKADVCDIMKRIRERSRSGEENYTKENIEYLEQKYKEMKKRILQEEKYAECKYVV